MTFPQLANLYAIVDRAVGDILAAHGELISCRPGCADCCHAVFDVSFIEAAAMALFLQNNAELHRSLQEAAKTAAVAFETLLGEQGDPARARIRCPLLGDDDLCLAYEARPVNCRTYGTPTVIGGKAHVCGLSGFESSAKYPTVDLAPLHQQLNRYSVELVGNDFGNRRFPLAWVVLKRDFFLPR